jgi:hypothetical protein
MMGKPENSLLVGMAGLHISDGAQYRGFCG